jgi:hypothetical protein
VDQIPEIPAHGQKEKSRKRSALRSEGSTPAGVHPSTEHFEKLISNEANQHENGGNYQQKEKQSEQTDTVSITVTAH